MVELKSINSFDNTPIYYRYKKKGNKNILFLHGTGRNHLLFEPYYQFFERMGFSTITPDLRGFGKSLSKNLSLENYAKDLNLILTKEKIKKVILVGNCLGASIAVKFYEMFPNKVEKLLLLTIFTREVVKLSGLLYSIISFCYYLGNLFSKLKIKRKYRYISFDGYTGLPDFVMPFIDFTGCSFTNWFLSAKLLLNYNINLDKIKKQKTVIIGEKDIFLKKEKIKQAIILKGVDHTIISRRPEKLFDILRQSIC